MAMNATILADQFKILPLTVSEDAAAAGWANAFDIYFRDAEANGIPVNGLGLVFCKATMISVLAGAADPVLDGIGEADQGAAKLQAGIIAYWGAISAGVAWSTVTEIITPPGLSGLVEAPSPIFASNTSGDLSQEAATLATATGIHTINVVGGIAVFPGLIGPQPIT